MNNVIKVDIKYNKIKVYINTIKVRSSKFVFIENRKIVTYQTFHFFYVQSMKNIILTEDSNNQGSKSLILDISMSSIKLPECSSQRLITFGRINCEKIGRNTKWFVSVAFSDLLDDPSVLIEGVLFRARYLGSTQLVCEGQPTKSTRMCQAEEAVSRIKVHMREHILSYFSFVNSNISFFVT